MELKERVLIALSYEPTKHEWRNQYGSEEFIFCDELNLYLFGKRFNRAERCECIEDFFLLLQSRLKNKKFEAMAEKKYLFKEGVIIQSHNASNGLNRLSTDEECIKALAANPRLADKFERLPESWKKDVANYEKKKAEAAKKAETAPKAAPKKDKDPATEEAATEEAATEEAATEEAATEDEI